MPCIRRAFFASFDQGRNYLLEFWEYRLISWISWVSSHIMLHQICTKQSIDKKRKPRKPWWYREKNEAFATQIWSSNFVAMKHSLCSYEAKHTLKFHVAKPRFIGEADFIFHTPQVCFICTSARPRDNKKCPAYAEHFLQVSTKVEIIS